MFPDAQTSKRLAFSSIVLVSIGGLLVLFANVQDLQQLVVRVATATSTLSDNDNKVSAMTTTTLTTTTTTTTSMLSDNNSTSSATKTNEANAFMTSVEEEAERYQIYSQAKSDLRASAKARVAQRGSIYDESKTRAFVKAPYPPFTNLAQIERPQATDTPLPTFQVVGLAKAGTSQLYRVLKSHPNVSSYYSKNKEFCVVDRKLLGNPLDPDSYKDEQRNQAIQQEVLRFYKKKQKLIAKTTSVNGCLNPGEVLANYHYFGKESYHSKILLLFRDPADWLWAVWNFWVQSQLDNKPAADLSNWANIRDQYRSPELFHEIIVGGDRLKAGGLLGNRGYSVNYPRILVELLGRENVLFLRNEDMEPEQLAANDSNFLQSLSNFTGLTNHFPAATSRTNCGDQKGSSVICEKTKPKTHSGSSYRIAGNRTMLSATRELIYLHFSAECRIWKEEFGIVYPSCLRALEEE